MKEKLEFMKEKLSVFHLDISDLQIRQFYQYYQILIEWNQVMNLTGITEFEEVVQKHFVDSLSIVLIKDMRDVDKIIDIGTGAGFPGIPLKIMFPHLQVTLLDSLNKRIHFLREVSDQLGLEKTEAVHGRAEDFARQEHMRECYDLCVSRAVANLSTLSEYCIPYVRIGGEFISYKSGEIESELKEAKTAVFLLGGKLQECKSFILPDSDIHRSLVRVKKVSKCSEKYPRKSGIPSRNPIS